LTEIAQRARRQDEKQPGADDHRPTEVAHVGVQRFGAGDREHHRGQCEEGDVKVPDHEADRVGR
jgi:hypothetical protein